MKHSDSITDYDASMLGWALGRVLRRKLIVGLADIFFNARATVFEKFEDFFYTEREYEGQLIADYGLSTLQQRLYKLGQWIYRVEQEFYDFYVYEWWDHRVDFLELWADHVGLYDYVVNTVVPLINENLGIIYGNITSLTSRIQSVETSISTVIADVWDYILFVLPEDMAKLYNDVIKMVEAYYLREDKFIGWLSTEYHPTEWDFRDRIFQCEYKLGEIFTPDMAIQRPFAQNITTVTTEEIVGDVYKTYVEDVYIEDVPHPDEKWLYNEMLATAEEIEKGPKGEFADVLAELEGYILPEEFVVK